MWYDSCRFSVDWVNLRVDQPDVLDLLSGLCRSTGLNLASFEPMARGQNFYEKSLSYSPAGYSAITVSFNIDPETGLVPVDHLKIKQYGILFSISGDGCRYIESNAKGGLRAFLNYLRQFPHNCSRIDVAMDIFDRSNPIVPLFQELAEVAYDPNPGHIAIKANMARVPGYVRWLPVWDPDEKRYTNNCYVGDRTSSQGCCCVYNKKMEIRSGRLKHIAQAVLDSVGCTDYWYRIEYRAKNKKYANATFEAACDYDAKTAFYYIADHLFVFVDQKYDLCNISKCETVVVWNEFLEWLASVQNVDFVELVNSPYVPTGLLKMAAYIRSNKEHFRRAFALINSDQELFEDLMYSSRDRPNPRYYNFDSEFRSQYEASFSEFVSKVV